MNKPLAIIIVIVVGMLGFLTIYSQTGKAPQVEKAGVSQGGHETQSSGGYGGGEASSGGYGAAPSSGGYGAPAPTSGGYGAPPGR